MRAIEIFVLSNNEHQVEKLPQYMTEESAGADLYSSENVVLKTGETKLVRTGLFFEIPSGYEVQIRPRSGLALKHGITVLNSPGTIDSDYRNEIMVMLTNFGKEDFEIKKGDRIAQMVVAPVCKASFVLTTELSNSERSGGFGSTGV